MTRTVEHLLATDQAANERRKTGKPIWAHRLRIKHLLSDDSSDERAVETAAKIVDSLRSSRWYAAEEQAAKTEERPSALDELIQEFTDVEGLEDLNETLSSLYDLADIDRVWVE